MTRRSLWSAIAIFSLLNCAQALSQAPAAGANTLNPDAAQIPDFSGVYPTNIPNTGQLITPLAPSGARFINLNPQQADYPDRLGGFAVTGIVSPDHKTLVVLTSGDYGVYNSSGAKDTAASTEFLFIFDISNTAPIQKQVIQITNSYNGMVFDPNGKAFYAAGGRDDSVHVYSVTDGVWAEAAGSPIALGHVPLQGGVAPVAAGIDITADGKRLVVANYENDSISVLTNSDGVWTKTADYDLRPGVINPLYTGVPGGEYPFWVTVKGNSAAYISSIRDREIDVIDISTETPVLTTRIALTGQPLKSTLDPSQRTLYVAEDQADSVAAINVQRNVLTAEAKVGAPTGVIPAAFSSLSGQNTNSVTVSPDGKTLYVTNGNMNDIAVVSLPLRSGNNVKGLIPTGMYPNSVVLTNNGHYMYVVNGKSPTGPNPLRCSSYTTPTNCAAANQYSLQLIDAGLQSFAVPSTSELAALTAQVAINNNYLAAGESEETKATMNFVASKIKHVVYIIKENRTFDQILGSLPSANGDPSLEAFDPANTPNLHAFAQKFVTLDNFYDIAEVSYDGWAWSTSGLAPDIVLRQTPVNYSFRGGTSYDAEGQNQNVNMVYRVYYPYPPGNVPSGVTDPNLLPGLVNTAAPDGPDNEINEGYLWSQALKAGMTVRNYGFFMDRLGNAVPYPQNTTVRQGNPADADLNDANTDVYFRGYDMNNADFYLYQEWAREFNTMYAKSGFPNLTLIRLPHDHFGNFSTALAGVNTPELQLADNDYAVGKIVETIAHSKYADSTLIFVIEDDAQDGPDHVDAHRSIAFIVGPYVKHGGAVVSTQYNTLNFIRTMERVLGFPPNHLTNALAQPMADVFDITQSSWNYNAVPSPILYNTTLPLPPKPLALQVPKPTHDAEYWASVTRGFDFSDADRVDPVAFNRILWKGLKGDTVYPGDANLKETHKRYAEALKKRGSAPTDKDGE